MRGHAQTVHFAASFALEWWCVTIATAEHNVSSRHSNAIRFENDRITDYRKNRLLKSTPKTKVNATGIPRHGIADAHNGLGTVGVQSGQAPGLGDNHLRPWDIEGTSPGRLYAASGDLRTLEADLAPERTQLKAGSSHHPWFQQKIPGAGRGKTVGNREFRIGLALDGARLDVDQSAGGNRDLEVPRNDW